MNKPQTQTPLHERKKQFLKTVGTAVVERGMAMGNYIPIQSESERLVVERVEIPIANLPAAFDGFKIALMSDFHLHPITKIDLVDEAIRIANSLNPDLTVLTGDYVWWEVEAIDELAPSLAGLNAKHGVFAAMGNHDIWTNASAVLSAFYNVRLPVLVNKGLPITQGDASIYLGAIDDGWSGEPDLDAALANRGDNMPTVLLAHEPDLADIFAFDGRVDLQLSGHTHGGQVRLPNYGALTLPHLGKKYDQGLYKVEDMWVYTNRGIGATLVPARINCPPEITEVILVRP